MNTLSDKDGNLRTDPMRIYKGAYKNLGDLLDRAKADPASDEATTSAHVMAIKQAMGDAIAEKNPSFNQYRQNYENTSRQIDEAQLMENARRNLVNGAGEISLEKVNNLLKSINKAQRSPGANPAKSVSPETWDTLVAARNELQAQAASKDIGRVTGSNTILNALQGDKYGVKSPEQSAMSNYVGNIAESGLHALGAALDPTGVGAVNGLVRFGKAGFDTMRASKLKAQFEADKASHEKALNARLQSFLNPQLPTP